MKILDKSKIYQNQLVLKIKFTLKTDITRVGSSAFSRYVSLICSGSFQNTLIFLKLRDFVLYLEERKE